MIDYSHEISILVKRLRERDTDPLFALAPVLDAYARISKIMNAGDDEKTDRQILDILRNIEKRHARLGEILVDDKRSAWKRHGKRPAWSRLLERIANGDCQGVVCWHTDRLMRQPWDLERLVSIALDRKENGFVVGSCFGDRRLDNGDDLFLLRILTAQANKESEDKSRRLRAKNESRRANGDARNGASAFGHRFGDEISDEQLELEREALKWGILAILDGESLGAVAREWNKRGLTTRRGVKWNALNVRQCVILARHAGLLEFKSVVIREIADAETVRIVSADTHAALMALFASRSRGRSHGGAEHFLSGIIRCDECGRAMVGSREKRRNGTVVRAYRCPPQGCRGVGVDAHVAERWAAIRIAETLSEPENMERISRMRAALSDVEHKIGMYETAIADLHAKARKNVARYAYYADQALAMEDLMAPLLAERARLVSAALSTEVVSGDVEQLRHEINDGSPEHRRRLARQALPDGFYVARVGRSRRLRGDEIHVRFSTKRHEATKRVAE